MAFDIRKRDPRATTAVFPRAANEIDIADWERRMRASEHIPMLSQKPTVEGEQIEQITKPGRKPQNALPLSLPVRTRGNVEFGPRRGQPA